MKVKNNCGRSRVIADLGKYSFLTFHDLVRDWMITKIFLLYSIMFLADELISTITIIILINYY